jgi:ribonucleoside-diphosphate reductase alpha chain
VPMSKEESAFARLTAEQQAFALEVVRIVNGAGKDVQAQVCDAVRRVVGASREEQESAPPRALRHRLPGERQSLTHKFAIAGHEGYVTVGLYKDGIPGELFIRMAKEGSTVSGLMDSFATAVSLALQHGVPLKLMCEKFQHTRFEPSGFTGNQEIPIAKSVMDYIFRWLEIRFVSGQQFPLFPALNVGPGPHPHSHALEHGAQGGAHPPSPAGGYDPRGAEAQSPSAASQPSPAMGNMVQGPAPVNLPPVEFGETTPPQGGLASEAARSQQPGASGYSGTPRLEDRGIYHPSNAMKDLVDMGDAPSCHVCGAIMTRNGSCYRCMSCGSTSGCS